MNSVTGLSLALLAVLLGGCTDARALKVSPMNPVAPVYRQGRPWLESTKRNQVALWLLTPEFKNDWRELLPPAFYLAVKNESREPLDFSTDDIMVTSDGRPVRLISYAEYRAEIVALGGAWLRGVQQGADQQKKMESPYLGLVEETRIDYAAQDLSGAITDRWKQLLDDARLMLDRKSYTLKPGEVVGGVVRLRPEDVVPDRPLRFTVALNGELHEFLFDAVH